MSAGGVLGKTIDFAGLSLRSAIDIYKKGGHVTMDYRDRDFRVLYNNNRIVVDQERFIKIGLLITKPVNSVEESLTQRSYSRLTRGVLYQKNTSLKSINKYNSNLEIGIRTFIKDVVNNRNGVTMSMFKGYTGIIDFIRKYLYESDQKFKRALNSSYISHIKLRSENKVPKLRMVPRLPELIKFFDYVKENYSGYDTSLIFAKG